MRKDAEERKEEWEGVEEPEEDLRRDDNIDEACEKLSGEDSVLLNELRQVIEARCYTKRLLAQGQGRSQGSKLTYRKCEECEANEYAEIPDERKYPHDGILIRRRCNLSVGRVAKAEVVQKVADKKEVGGSRTGVHFGHLASSRIPPHLSLAGRRHMQSLFGRSNTNCR